MFSETASLMRRIKLTVAYDGTGFCGWQIQKTGRTVQEELQKVLAVLHKHPVAVTGSGRTDAGVHALGQVAHFDTDLHTMPPDKFVPAMNSLLPADIRVRDACEVEQAFHARYGALRREYRYHMTLLSDNDPFSRPYSYPLSRMPDIRSLNGYAAAVLGTHDFTAFSAAGDSSESKVRTIYTSSFGISGRELIYTICGNAFLWKMVRSLVGTMLDLEREGSPAEKMTAVLESGDRGKVGTTAPARGLFLCRVRYADG